MANQLLLYHRKILLKIVLTAVKKCRNLYQLEPMFVIPYGYVEDRDINAAKNILKKALSTLGHRETNTLVGDLPSGLIGFGLSSEGESMNQESPSL